MGEVKDHMRIIFASLIVALSTSAFAQTPTVTVKARTVIDGKGQARS